MTSSNWKGRWNDMLQRISAWCMIAALLSGTSLTEHVSNPKASYIDPLASFAERQHLPHYEYSSPTGHTIHDAVNFLGEALTNPEIVKAYNFDTQSGGYEVGGFFDFAEFYSHSRIAGQIPPTILKGLEQPTLATSIGGNTTVIDGYTPIRSDRNKQ